MALDAQFEAVPRLHGKMRGAIAWAPIRAIRESLASAHLVRCGSPSSSSTGPSGSGIQCVGFYDGSDTNEPVSAVGTAL